MKKISYKLIIMVIVSLIIILPLNYRMEASTAPFYYISNAIGETYDKVGISYHTKLENSYIVLSEQSNFGTSTNHQPDESEWSRSVKKSETEVGFPDKRLVCRVNLEGLKENTTYYYKIVAGTTSSGLLKFKTASNGDKVSLAWITDSQAYGNYYTNVNNLINSLVRVDNNISLVVNTGDVIDQGGEVGQWDAYFNQIPNASQMLHATIPGNHEYYIENLDYNVGDSDIYNQFFNNPKNGATERLNTSYYFKYNQILFIMLDTIQTNMGTPQDLEVQKAWFNEVCKNNESQFIIVGMHLGLYGAASYASAAKTMRAHWEDTFENNSVDLVLSGHEHLFSATYPVYNQKIDYDRGVTYVVGNAAGTKTSGINQNENYDNRQYVLNSTKHSGAIITVDRGKLTLALYDETGDPILDENRDHVKVILNSRREKAASFNLSSFKTSSKIEFDSTNQIASFTWRNNIYGHVTKIAITRRGFADQPVIVHDTITSISRSLSLGDTYGDQNYFYNLEITMVDGTVHNETIELINKEATRDDDYNAVIAYEKGTQTDDKPTNPGCMGTIMAGILSLSLLIPLCFLKKRQ